MLTVNDHARAVLEALTAGLSDTRSGRSTTHGTDGGYMPIHAELLCCYSFGRVYSVAHYHRPGGGLHEDPRRDPDMEFLRLPTGAWIPMTYQQDAGYSVFTVSVVIRDGRPTLIGKALHQAHVDLANRWMANIAEKQRLPALTEAA